MNRLETEVAFLPLRVLGARLDGLRDGLLVFFVGVVLLSVAAAVYLLADLLVAAAPVVMLASRVTVAGPTSNATRRVVGQWGGAGGACCEDHFALVWRFGRFARRRGKQNRFAILAVLTLYLVYVAITIQEGKRGTSATSPLRNDSHSVPNRSLAAQI